MVRTGLAFWASVGRPARLNPKLFGPHLFIAMDVVSDLLSYPEADQRKSHGLPAAQTRAASRCLRGRNSSLASMPEG